MRASCGTVCLCLCVSLRNIVTFLSLLFLHQVDEQSFCLGQREEERKKTDLKRKPDIKTQKHWCRSPPVALNWQVRNHSPGPLGCSAVLLLVPTVGEAVADSSFMLPSVWCKGSLRFLPLHSRPPRGCSSLFFSPHSTRGESRISLLCHSTPSGQLRLCVCVCVWRVQGRGHVRFAHCSEAVLDATKEDLHLQTPSCNMQRWVQGRRFLQLEPLSGCACPPPCSLWPFKPPLNPPSFLSFPRSHSLIHNSHGFLSLLIFPGLSSNATFCLYTCKSTWQLYVCVCMTIYTLHVHDHFNLNYQPKS